MPYKIWGAALFGIAALACLIAADYSRVTGDRLGFRRSLPFALVFGGIGTLTASVSVHFGAHNPERDCRINALSSPVCTSRPESPTQGSPN